MGYQYFWFKLDKSQELICNSLTNKLVPLAAQRRGVYVHITWDTNTVYNNKSEFADDLDESLQDLGRYEGLGCKVKYFKLGYNVKPGSLEDKLKKLREQYAAEVVELRQMDCTIIAKTFKRPTLTCKRCGQRINISSMTSNFCPYCGTDTRSETNMIKINEKRQRVLEMQRRLEKLEKEVRDKLAVPYWYVAVRV